MRAFLVLLAALSAVASRGAAQSSGSSTPAQSKRHATIDPIGLYDFEAVSPNGVVPGRIKIEGSAGRYTGTIAPENMAVDPLKSVVAEGNQLTLTAWIEEAGGETTMRLAFVGDSFSGSWATVTGAGDMKGKRVPK